MNVKIIVRKAANNCYFLIGVLTAPKGLLEISDEETLMGVACSKKSELTFLKGLSKPEKDEFGQERSSAILSELLESPIWAQSVVDDSDYFRFGIQRSLLLPAPYGDEAEVFLVAAAFQTLPKIFHSPGNNLHSVFSGEVKAEQGSLIASNMKLLDDESSAIEPGQGVEGILRELTFSYRDFEFVLKGAQRASFYEILDFVHKKVAALDEGDFDGDEVKESAIRKIEEGVGSFILKFNLDSFAAYSARQQPRNTLSHIPCGALSFVNYIKELHKENVFDHDPRFLMSVSDHKKALDIQSKAIQEILE